MQITFNCPACQAELEADGTLAGSQVPCPKCQAAVAIPKKGPGPGVTIGGFYIRKLIGRGGMGEVYLARQISLDRDVALKILPSQLSAQKSLVERFFKEVHLLAKLDHPNIVTAYETGDDHGVLYLAMNYVSGESLDKRLKQKGPLDEAEALRIVAKLAEALDYAWTDHHLLHRDIKPANILLTAHGEIKLTDLGLAKSLDEVAEMTLSGTILGTPNYMSPEQVNGQSDLDCRADIYSLGATLYYLLTGKLPFEGTSLTDTLRKQLNESLPDPRAFRPEISEACVRLLEIMLAKDRDQRHPDWKTLMVDLKRVQAGQLPTQEPLQAGESVLLRLKAIMDTPGKAPAAHRPAAAGPARQPSTGKVRNRKIIVGIAAGAAVVIIGGASALVLGLKSGCSGGSVSHPDAAAVSLHAAPPATAELPEASRSDAAIAQQPGRLTETSLQPEQAPSAESLTKLHQKYSDAITFTRDHPYNYDGALDLLEPLSKSAAGTELAEKLAAEIKRVTMAKQAAVDKTLAGLKDKVDQAVSAGKYDDALKLLEDESGQYAGATAAARAALAQEVRQKKQATEESQAKKLAEDQRQQQIAEAQSKLATLTQALAGELLKADYAAALQLSTEASKDEALNVVSNEVSALQEQVKQAAALSDGLLASFERDKGKDVTVEFKTGQAERLKITEISKGKIAAQRQVAAGFIGRDFSIDDLSWREKMKRLGADQTPAASVRRGLVAAQGGDLARAEKEFAAAGEGLGAALAQAVQPKETATAGSGGSERQPAKGVSRSDTATAKPSAGEEASHSDAATVKPSAGEDASRSDAATVKASTAKTAVHHKVKLKPATKKVVEEALAELKKANPDMTKTPVYSITQEGIKLVLNQEPNLKDLSALAGLPLVELNVSETGVSDLNPLTGMPLQTLNSSLTRVSDLSPLAGMPLTDLSVSGTDINDLSPLRGMRLKILELGRTQVADLSVLAGMPIGYLGLQYTPASDLTPLKGMPLIGELNIIGCSRITDFTPIKNMSLRWLKIGGSDMTNLKGITGIKIQNLLIVDDPRIINDLGNVPDYFKGLQTVQYNEQKMTLDEFKKQFGSNPAQSANASDATAPDVIKTSGAKTAVPESAVSLKPATEATVQEALARLRKANPGLEKADLKYEVREEGIILNLGKNPKLKDITALSGVPIINLNLSSTTVSDLRPLAGLPITDLNLLGCPVTDLRPLAGMPLKLLNLSATLVKDVKPLAGMPLEDLTLTLTKVNDLTPLKGMPLRLLNIINTPVSDLAPLKGMNLTSLGCACTPVRDLALLREMTSLVAFYMQSMPNVTDVSPLTRLNLKYLGLGGNKGIKSYKPLAGMPVANLNIIGPVSSEDFDQFPDYFPSVTHLTLVAFPKPEWVLRFKNLETVSYWINGPQKTLSVEEFVKMLKAPSKEKESK